MRLNGEWGCRGPPREPPFFAGACNAFTESIDWAPDPIYVKFRVVGGCLGKHSFLLVGRDRQGRQNTRSLLLYRLLLAKSDQNISGKGKTRVKNRPSILDFKTVVHDQRNAEKQNFKFGIGID